MLLPSLNAELRLDPKGRVMLPRPLRAALELAGVNQLVAFANGGPRAGLAFYRVDAFAEMARKYQGADPMDPRARLFALAIHSTAQRVTIDTAGRMLIPKELRSLLSLDRELYLYTAGSWFEVWDRSRWAEQAYPNAADLWEQVNGLGTLAGALTPAVASPEGSP
jgi:MraZ protein